jgi:hypothetical protein
MVEPYERFDVNILARVKMIAYSFTLKQSQACVTDKYACDLYFADKKVVIFLRERSCASYLRGAF